MNRRGFFKAALGGVLGSPFMGKLWAPEASELQHVPLKSPTSTEWGLLRAEQASLDDIKRRWPTLDRSTYIGASWRKR